MVCHGFPMAPPCRHGSIPELEEGLHAAQLMHSGRCRSVSDGYFARGVLWALCQMLAEQVSDSCLTVTLWEDLGSEAPSKALSNSGFSSGTSSAPDASRLTASRDQSGERSGCTEAADKTGPEKCKRSVPQTVACLGRWRWASCCRRGRGAPNNPQCVTSISVCAVVVCSKFACRARRVQDGFHTMLPSAQGEVPASRSRRGFSSTAMALAASSANTATTKDARRFSFNLGSGCTSAGN